MSAGRGRGSVMMRSHMASPFISGRMAGKSSTNYSLSCGGKARIAASISLTVLIVRSM